MTYQDAKRLLPAGAYISSTFGYPGEEGYSEFWRSADGASRWEISRRWPWESEGWVVRKVD